MEVVSLGSFIGGGGITNVCLHGDLVSSISLRGDHIGLHVDLVSLCAWSRYTFLSFVTNGMPYVCVIHKLATYIR